MNSTPGLNEACRIKDCRNEAVYEGIWDTEDHNRPPYRVAYCPDHARQKAANGSGYFHPTNIESTCWAATCNAPAVKHGAFGRPDGPIEPMLIGYCATDSSYHDQTGAPWHVHFDYPGDRRRLPMPKPDNAVPFTPPEPQTMGDVLRMKVHLVEHMDRLAAWFDAHPGTAAKALAYVNAPAVEEDES